jgi:hypothetical protein
VADLWSETDTSSHFLAPRLGRLVRHPKQGRARASRHMFPLTRGCYTSSSSQEDVMAKGGRETKKPKKEKPKTIAAAPSTKATTASAPGTKK